jgi:hypothetical protein
LDRRTNRPEGAGGASPTIVTSRVGGDGDLDDDNGQETPTAGIVAAPRRTPRKPAAQADPVTAAPTNGNGNGNGSGTGNGNGTDRTARGAAATSDAPADEAATSAVKDMLLPASSTDLDTDVPAPADGVVPDGVVPDATIIDGVPAFPADDIGSSWSRSRSPRPKDDAPSAASSSEAVGLFPAADPSPTAPSSPALSSAAPSSTEAPTVSPAAFAWDMPDPPPNSPSSPARTFLRTGTSGRNQASGRSSTRSPDAAVSAPSIAPSAAPAEAPAAPRRTQKKASKRSARQAHLTVARVEPWSVMKFSFVVSLVAFVILFVAVSVLYGVLSGLGVFDSLQKVVSSVTSSQTSAGVNAAKWWSASRVLSYTALLGSLNIVLITAMSTIGAVVYNLTSRLVGGVEVTLRETE